MSRARQPDPAPEKTEEIPYEEAARELDTIVRALEEERLPLEELVVRYERGTVLLRLCQEQLDRAQQRISLINSNSRGASTLTPFDPEAPPPEPPSVGRGSSARKSASAPASAPTASDNDEIRLF